MPIDSDPHPSSHELADLIGLRRSLIRLQDETRLLRRHLLQRKYSPAQPPVPAGNTGGGRWTSGESGGGPRAGFGFGFGGSQGEPGEAGSDGATVYDTSGSEAWASYSEGFSDDGSLFERDVTNRDGSTIHSEYAASRTAGFDERQTVTLNSGETITFETTGREQTIRYGGADGEVVARTLWTPSGPERDATVQPAFLQRGVGAAGTILFGWQSQQNGVDGRQAVMGFEPMEFRPNMGVSGSLELSYVGRVSQDELERACRRWPQTVEFADRAANAAGPVNQYPSPAAYGTDVHSRFKEYIDDLRDFNFRAERSFSKELFEATREAESRYGYPGSIRVDAYEYRSDGTLCIYDLKTGRAGLNDRRAEILATATALGMRPIRRIIVTEVRPRS